MGLYYLNSGNRLGDEIQMTAVIKYFCQKGIEVDYTDRNGLISARSIFPDNLVNFVDSNRNNLPELKTRNLWIWEPFLRSRGIYAEVKTTAYNPDIDVVMAPVIYPSYNQGREFKSDRIKELFSAIVSEWPNSLLVVDRVSRGAVAGITDKVVFSNNFHETFELIHRSKVFLGGDTGTSHYAGAIGHPKMVLLYPDMSGDRNAFRWEVELMAKEFNEPDFLDHNWDSTPCCDPSHRTVLRLDQTDTRTVMDTIGFCIFYTPPLKP